MSYEVELKFPLVDKDRLLAALKELEAQPQPEMSQSDRYFAHPARDFGETNEAFRIRQSGEKTKLTYKGPLLDKETKTRREIELSLADGNKTAEDMVNMLNALGFSEVRAVCKTRTPYELTWQGREMEITLDDVEGLGWFLEIETLTEEEDPKEAQEAILSLAKHWNLENAERRSYLTMLLEKGANS
ncbi:MAG: class IV adenylate cyclase [Planctomycetaceae bacterium]|nr:class IV adenylate cyclase [Planctomycetaceae bacterium]